MSSSSLAVADGHVVGIYYTLKVDGEVVDTNRKGGSPLLYLHGKHNIVAGLEKALEGKQKDDFVEVAVAPEDGYGERNEQAVQTVPRGAFPEDAEIEVGARFVARDDQGNAVPTVVVGVEGDDITVDHNHPLAGQTLNFEVTIAGVREATDEEKQHGHAHGDGGHHH